MRPRGARRASDAAPCAGAGAPAPSRRSGASSSPPDDLNPKHTFANFVVGPSNQLAHAAAIAAAGGGGPPLQPALHLRRHRPRQDAPRARDRAPRARGAPDARILYVSAERFTNEFIEALQHHRMDEFRARYREQLRPAARRRHPVPRRPRADAGGVLPHVQRAPRRRQADRRHERQVPAAARSAWRSGSSRASRGASSPTSRRPSSRRASRSSARRPQLEGIALADDVALFLAQTIRSQRARARRHADPPRGEVVAHRAARSTSTSRAAELAPRRRPRAQTMQRRGHPARRLPPLPAPLERSPLARTATRASPSRATWRCTSASSASSAASPSSGAPSATAITRP